VKGCSRLSLPTFNSFMVSCRERQRQIWISGLLSMLIWRYILDTLRKVKPGVRVIFPSSLAVFGQTSDEVIINESTITLPQSPYGARKFMTETLLNDFSRRGLLDGRIVRLPTIIVRPEKPTGAASSFCSGIIREPLNGEKSVLSVPRNLKLWVCSTRTIIKSLLIAGNIPESAYG